MPRVARSLLPLLLAALAATAAAADLRIGIAADVTSIDPHHQNIAPNNNVGWHVFDALTHVDDDARLVPGLATAWRAIDSTTWEFTLRRGVRFHDGAEFTAEDAIASIERAARLPNGQFAGFVQRITGASALDAHTLRLRTASAYAMLPYDLNSVFIVPRRLAGASSEEFNSGSAMIGTGPFRFVRFARGERVELAANRHYWDGAPAWERVVLRIVPSDPARIAALLSGELDLIEQIPTADLARLRASERHRVEQKVSWRTLFFHLDQSRAQAPSLTDRSGRPLAANPFRDSRVRRAISRAINRQAIVARVMEGAALPASNLVSPPVFGHNASIPVEPFDPDGARKLLAEAGYPDGFALTVAAPNNRYVNDDQIAQAVAQMLSRVGLAVRVQTLPMNVYLTRARAGEFAFAMLGWGSFSGDLALRALLAAPDAAKGYGAWNWGGYANPKLDALLDRAFATVHEARREALAREAMALAMGEVAVIPLHHQLAAWALRRPLAYTGRTDEYTFAHRVRPQ